MKKIIIFTLVFTFLMLTACGGNTIEETTTLEVITEPEIETTTECWEIDRTGEEIYQSHPDLTPVDYTSPVILPLSEDMGQEYVDKLTFICDSPTYWMWPWGLLGGGEDTNSIWTGPEGTMTLAYQSSYCILDPFDNTEKPIRQVVEEHKPEYLILAVGINGVSFMDEEEFKADYEDLVSDILEISPETKLMCQSIYPITPAYRWWGDITNVMITEANSWILDVAEEYGVPYLDTFSVLLAEDGHAKRELMGSDGLHPNYEGLKTVLQYIRTHKYREVKAPETFG